MEILIILTMDCPKASFELQKFLYAKIVYKIIFEVSMSTNVAMIKTSGGYVFNILENYLDRRALNTNLFRQKFAI